MKTIKQRILISFCIAVAVTIAVIGAAVSWRMNSSVSDQSKVMADYMAGRTYRVADSYNEMLRTCIEDIKKEMRRTNKDLSGDPSVAKNIESQQLAPLAARLQAAAASSGADFIMVFDLQGRLQSSFPNPKNIDEKKVADYYQSWELGTRVRDRLKSKEAADEGDLVSVTRHDSPFLKDFGLEKFDIAGKGGISIATAGIVRDDFQEPMGICITGKLLNRYDGPLTKLYDATGSASLIYLENIPIVHAGFQKKGDAKLDEASLQISAETREKVFKSEKTANLLLALAAARGFIGHQTGDIEDSAYGGLQGQYYPLDDLVISAGAMVSDKEGLFAFSAEYQTPIKGLACFASIAKGEYHYDYAFVGLRFYFGGEHKTLIRRHREDNVANSLFEGFLSIRAGGSPTPFSDPDPCEPEV